MRNLSSLPLAGFMLVVGLVTPAAAEIVAETAARLEAELGGRIGVVLREQGAAAPLAEHRADERFPMASTFKALLCGAVLARVDAGEEDLGHVIPYGPEVLVSHSPVTETRVGAGMSVGDLCEATVTISDNAAANLLLDAIGGPEGLTRFLRDTGDEITRLDRRETELNEALPGDPRDTTTPRAMASTLETLLFGEVLSPASRTRLNDWMTANQVADALIRASLPEGWGIADRTGAGGNGTRGIIAVIRPPHGAAWLAAVYLTGNEADFDTRNKAIAEIGAAMVEAIRAR